MKHLGKSLLAALIVPLALAACLFVPGKFESTLDVRADRSFTFTYKGEVNAVDISGMMGKAMAGLGDSLKEAGAETKGADDADEKLPSLEPTPEERAKKDVEYREIAEKLTKEAGYRSVVYRGNGVFFVDYAISGKLSHGFVFPYNQDAAMLFPWVAVELRGKDSIRIKAPGFALQDSENMGMGGGGGEELARMEGSFTLTTDAEIVSQNEESGAVASGAGKTIRWKITPTTQEAPMAVLRVAGL